MHCGIGVMCDRKKQQDKWVTFNILYNLIIIHSNTISIGTAHDQYDQHPQTDCSLWARFWAWQSVDLGLGISIQAAICVLMTDETKLQFFHDVFFLQLFLYLFSYMLMKPINAHVCLLKRNWCQLWPLVDTSYKSHVTRCLRMQFRVVSFPAKGRKVNFLWTESQHWNKISWDVLIMKVDFFHMHSDPLAQNLEMLLSFLP